MKPVHALQDLKGKLQLHLYSGHTKNSSKMVDSGRHMEVPPVEVLQVMSRASWARPARANGGQQMDILL
jgi:hypothetical protein